MGLLKHIKRKHVAHVYFRLFELFSHHNSSENIISDLFSINNLSQCLILLPLSNSINEHKRIPSHEILTAKPSVRY